MNIQHQRNKVGIEPSQVGSNSTETCSNKLLQPFEKQPDLNLLQTTSDVFSGFFQLSRRWGFEFFLIGKLAPGGGVKISGTNCISNLPSYSFDQLSQFSLENDWQVSNTLKSSSAPFWAGSNVERSGAVDQYLSEELSATHCLCLPLSSMDDSRPFFLLFGPAVVQSTINVADVLYHAQRLYSRMQTISQGRKSEKSVPLSQRQLECLSWASRGKTSGEISSIVTLSEHTVNHYLNACCRALDCVNRTQAVAQALRLKIID